MLSEFPTKIKDKNNIDKLFDIDLKNKDELLVYYQNIYDKQKDSESKNNILNILNGIMNGDKNE